MSEKRPRVKIVIGKAMSLTTGLMKTFIIPRTIASTMLLTSVTSAPGIKYVATIIAIAETNK